VLVVLLVLVGVLAAVVLVGVVLGVGLFAGRSGVVAQTGAATAVPETTPPTPVADPVTRMRDRVQALPAAALPPEATENEVPEGSVEWAGSRRTLPRSPVGLGRLAAALGTGPRGLLVLWHTADSTGAEDFDAQLGRLTSDGGWQRVDTAEVSSLRTSPDGKQYGYLARRAGGGTVTDELVLRRSSDDALLGRRPVGSDLLGVDPLAVTDAGMVLTGSRGPELWTGRGDPEPLTTGTVTGFGGNVLLLTDTTAGDCPDRPAARAWQVGPDGGRQLWRGCGAQDRQLLSPDGRYLVAPTGWLTPLDLSAGARPVATPVDTADWTRNVSVSWEPDGRHVQLGFDLQGPDDGQGEVTVRCAVATGACTRAP
jgi:hypothetical protein